MGLTSISVVALITAVNFALIVPYQSSSYLYLESNFLFFFFAMAEAEKTVKELGEGRNFYKVAPC